MLVIFVRRIGMKYIGLMLSILVMGSFSNTSDTGEVLTVPGMKTAASDGLSVAQNEKGAPENNVSYPVKEDKNATPSTNLGVIKDVIDSHDDASANQGMVIIARKGKNENGEYLHKCACSGSLLSGMTKCHSIDEQKNTSEKHDELIAKNGKGMEMMSLADFMTYNFLHGGYLGIPLPLFGFLDPKFTFNNYLLRSDTLTKFDDIPSESERKIIDDNGDTIALIRSYDKPGEESESVVAVKLLGKNTIEDVKKCATESDIQLLTDHGLL